jgi:hypothetical protein
MDCEITPEPGDDERQAILLALGSLLEGRSTDPRGAWGREPESPLEDE